MIQFSDLDLAPASATAGVHTGRHATPLLLLAALTLASLMPSLSQAATPATATGSTTVDWTGVWVLAGGPLDVHFEGFLFSPGRTPEGADSPYPPEPLPKFKGRYLEIFEQRSRSLLTGDLIGDSGAACTPQGMPRFWVGPYAFEIAHTPKQINLFQEWNEQTRRIYLDGRPPPADADPTYNGHSVGRWQEGVLVVETTNVRADTGIGGQDQAEHSAAMQIVERFIQTGPNELKVEVTVNDPEAFVEPWVSTYELRRKPDMTIAEYRCTENNRNPLGEDGRTLTILKDTPNGTP